MVGTWLRVAVGPHPQIFEAVALAERLIAASAPDYTNAQAPATHHVPHLESATGRFAAKDADALCFVLRETGLELRVLLETVERLSPLFPFRGQL